MCSISELNLIRLAEENSVTWGNLQPKLEK